MADEYIKRKYALFPPIDLCVRCEAVRRNTRNCNTCVINDITQEIRDIPADDVAPVRHGRNESETGFLCSVCTFGDFGGFHGYKPNYCPNCGARMDGKEQDDG